MDTGSDARSALLEKIRVGIRHATTLSSDTQKTNSRYIVISIVASALSTVLAAAAAALGPVIAQQLTGLPTPGPAWKLTCGVIAVCTGIATVFSALQKQFSLAERLAKATACNGKLHALEFALTVNNRDTVEVAKEYEMAIASYPEIIL